MEQHREPIGVKRPQCGVWRFADAQLHETEGRLVVGGQSRTLERSSHEILRYLLEHASEVVSKEELLQAGWPGRVVAENSLAKAISRLRAALGSSGEALRVVHGYGYRLNGPARFTAATTTQPEQGEPEPPPSGLAGPERERLRTEAVERQSRQLLELKRRRGWMLASAGVRECWVHS